MAVHFARHPPETEIAIPNDNTTRQAQALDLGLAEAQAQAASGSDNTVAGTVRIKLQDTWIEIAFDVNSLRSALGFPLHNIFNQGIFHQPYNPTEVADADDMDDIDHM